MLTLRTYLALTAGALLFGGAVVLGQWLSQSDQAVTLIGNLGYVGLIGLGAVSGLNFILPVPAAAFAALYSAAGLTTIGVILALALGTLIADTIGFWVGTKLRLLVADSYPKITAYAHTMAQRGGYFVFIFVLLYAAFVPFPNEALLIPLAISGVKFRYLVVPLIIGNILHQTILIVGVTTLTSIFG